MIISILNTSDIKGGAARAAYRLHKGLNEIEQDSYMIVRKKFLPDKDRDIFKIDIKKSTIE